MSSCWRHAVHVHFCFHLHNTTSNTDDVTSFQTSDFVLLACLVCSFESVGVHHTLTRVPASARRPGNMMVFMLSLQFESAVTAGRLVSECSTDLMCLEFSQYLRLYLCTGPETEPAEDACVHSARVSIVCVQCTCLHSVCTDRRSARWRLDREKCSLTSALPVRLLG